MRAKKKKKERKMKLMKRLRRLFVCLVCLCVVMSAQGCGSIAGVSSGKRIIRISHAQSETHPEHLGLLKFKEYVEENLESNRTDTDRSD